MVNKMLKKLTIVNGIIQDKLIDGVPVYVQIVKPRGKKNVRTLIPMKTCIGITNHNTGNKSADDSDHAKWIQGVEDADKLYVSPHIFVDADSITQVIPLNEVGYHAGDGQGDGNMKTIGVEICEDREVGKAEANAIKLNAALILTYTTWRVYKHQDWNGKFCPHIILARNGWGKFVEDIKATVKVSQSQANEMDEFEVALKKIETAGVTKSPDYWRDHAVDGNLIKGEHARDLIINMANVL